MKLFQAKMESSHFSFQAFGKTETEARAALIKGFRIHARQYNAKSNWYAAYDDSIYVIAVETGSAYRDAEVLA